MYVGKNACSLPWNACNSGGRKNKDSDNPFLGYCILFLIAYMGRVPGAGTSILCNETLLLFQELAGIFFFFFSPHHPEVCLYIVSRTECIGSLLNTAQQFLHVFSDGFVSGEDTV